MAVSPASGPPAQRFEPAHLSLLLIVQAIWGVNWIASKAAVSEFHPLLLTALRFGVLLIVVWPFLRWHPGQMRNLALGCLLTGPLAFSTGFIGLAMAKDVAPLAVASNLGAPFATLLAAIFLGDRIGPWRGTALLMSFGGIVFMGFDPKIFADTTALLLTALSSLFWAIATIFMRRVRGVGAPGTQAWLSVITFPSMLAAALMFETNPVQSMLNASWWAWASLAMLVFGATLVGHTGFFWLLSRYPISMMAPFLLLAPIIGALAGVYWYGDPLTWRMVVGAAMTLAGVLIITLREGRRRPERALAVEEAA